MKMRSIYIKFLVIFLATWWGINALTFGFVARSMTRNIVPELNADLTILEQPLKDMRDETAKIFIMSTVCGTIIILFAVRQVVKPIKRLSQASKEVAKGNFLVEIPVTSNDEVGQLTSDFNKMVKELNSLDNYRNEFVDNVSHEFRTPVTSIKGFAKLLSESNLDDKVRQKFCRNILSESDRLMNLSSNLLKISQLNNQVIYEKKIFSLDEQIRSAIIFLEPQWSAKQIEFDVSLEKISFLGDHDLIWQVWLNLLNNAIKFSEIGGLIKIQMHNFDNHVQIIISDNGVGMTKTEKERIFERFYKGDLARNSEGSGLGLVIVKKIIDCIGGNIFVKSQLNYGTTFTIELNK